MPKGGRYEAEHSGIKQWIHSHCWLLVVAIIGILATIVGASTYGHIEKTRRQTTWTQIGNLKVAISQFEMDVGRFPKDLQELVYEGDESWPGPFLDSDTVPTDGWGGTFVMEKTGKRIKVRSPGPDGKLQTEDDLWK